MSKTITIPASAGNRVTIILNGRSYELPTGVEISVPDEVAALLSANEEMAPQTRQVAAGEIPPITAADKGKVLGTDGETGELKWTEGGGSGGGGGATIVHVALDSQGSGSLDMTAGEILAAAQTGPMILVESVEGYGVIGAGPLGISMNQTGVFSVLSASGLQYTAASADDYPSHSGGG